MGKSFSKGLNKNKMSNLKIILKKASIIRSIYYNFKYLNFKQAIKLPIIICNNTKIKGKGKIELEKNAKKIYIGEQTLKWCNPKREYTYIFLDKNSKLKLKNNVYIGLGTKIEISNHGICEIGENTVFTGKSNIICKNYIQFNNNCLISWNTLFLDSDGHTIIKNNIANKLGKIIIKNKIWIGCNVTILKNTIIGSNSIIGANSLIKGKFKNSNILIAGNPGIIIAKNIKWKIDEPKGENNG